MFKHIIDQLTLQFQLARQLRLELKLARVKEELNLRERFAAHGRYRIGDFEVLRSDASGGYDTARFFKDNPKIAEKLHVVEYQKPRVERVRVQRAPRSPQKTA